MNENLKEQNLNKDNQSTLCKVKNLFQYLIRNIPIVIYYL